jgi:hypothetical protein
MQKFIDQLYLSRFSNVQVEKILRISQLKNIKKNELLVKSKTVCDKSFFLIEGAFVCRYIDEGNAIRKIINFFLEDFQNTFTCNDSFFTGKKTNYEIIALVDSKYIEIKKSDLDGSFGIYKIKVGQPKFFRVFTIYSRSIKHGDLEILWKFVDG